MSKMENVIMYLFIGIALISMVAMCGITEEKKAAAREVERKNVMTAPLTKDKEIRVFNDYDQRFIQQFLNKVSKEYNCTLSTISKGQYAYDKETTIYCEKGVKYE